MRRSTRYVMVFSKRFILEPAEHATHAARKLITTWKSVPPNVRRLVYRSLLAVGLIITLKERTLPNLGKIGDAAGHFAGELIKGSVELVGRGLAEAVRSILGTTGSSLWQTAIIYWGGLAFMGIVTLFVLLPVLLEPLDVGE